MTQPIKDYVSPLSKDPAIQEGAMAARAQISLIVRASPDIRLGLTVHLAISSFLASPYKDAVTSEDAAKFVTGYLWALGTRLREADSTLRQAEDALLKFMAVPDPVIPGYA